MSHATWHVLRARAEQARRNLEEAEQQLEELSVTWNRYDDALNALNTREDELAPDEFYRADKLLVAARQLLEAKDIEAARPLLCRAENLLFKK